MRTIIRFIILALVFSWTYSVQAKGPFAVLVLRGGGLAEDIEISEPDLLGFFSFSDFSTMRLPEAPQDAQLLLENAYEVTRYTVDDRTGKRTAFDRLYFIPGESQTAGWVFYDGIINGSSEYDQKWYRADPQAAIVLQRSIARQIDPVGSFLDERRSWITILGILLGVSVLSRWAWERWIQRRA